MFCCGRYKYANNLRCMRFRGAEYDIYLKPNLDLPPSQTADRARPHGNIVQMTVALERLKIADPLETRPVRWRIGLIALATDHITECDLHALRPNADLGIYANRVQFTNPTTAENLIATLPHLTAAASQILPGETLDAVAYACTAASALIGDDAVREAIQAAKPEVPVITPPAAASDGFVALGCRKISVLTPYTEAVTAPVVRYFSERGLDVLNASCLGLADDTEIARIAPKTIVAAAETACDRDAEALFISCTALRAVQVLQPIEDRLGVPVVSSNQAMFWKTIREADCDLAISGFGRLLEN